jgi:hypothetical protein
MGAPLNTKIVVSNGDTTSGAFFWEGNARLFILADAVPGGGPVDISLQVYNSMQRFPNSADEPAAGSSDWIDLLEGSAGASSVVAKSHAAAAKAYVCIADEQWLAGYRGWVRFKLTAAPVGADMNILVRSD